MKKIYSTILLVALALFSFSISAQVSEDETGEFLTKEGYLIGIDDKVNPPNGETPDLSFSFSTGIGLSNHDIIELAREQALNAWFARQYNLMKNEIGNRFNKDYPNFEEARNDYFKNWEKPNILSNASWVKSKYDSRVSAGLGDREVFVRNLKLLELRESELNLGNINNTSYGAFNFNGVPIGNITSLSQLNALRNYEIQTFSYNEVSIYHNSGVSQFMLIDIINDMGSYSNRFDFDYGILNELLSLQINHYNTIGNGLPYHYTWYQLDLMQMYLNNIWSFVPYASTEVFPRSFGTRSFLETYANQHRRGTVSIWDNGYYDYLVQGMLHPNETDERAIEAAEYSAELTVEYERQYALDNLLGSVTDVDLRIQSVIEDLGYSNHSEEANWFNSHHDESDSFYNYLESNNSSPEAINFARAATEALRNDGAVDFNNEFIKAKSFIGTLADCVLNALISSGNNLFKSTSEAFTQGKSKYRIKFTTFNNPSNLAIATTSLPDPFDVIDISFNLARINDTSINLAGQILHETIHAELHRIKLSNNAGPNPLPTAQYNWYVALWEFFENDDIGRTATSAEHTFMANYYINPIASGLREFDENTHPLENYKYFAWTGLQDYGKLNGYITQTELSNLANLSQIITNDTHTNPCD